MFFCFSLAQFSFTFFNGLSSTLQIKQTTELQESPPSGIRPNPRDPHPRRLAGFRGFISGKLPGARVRHRVAEEREDDAHSDADAEHIGGQHLLHLHRHANRLRLFFYLTKSKSVLKKIFGLMTWVHEKTSWSSSN